MKPLEFLKTTPAPPQIVFTKEHHQKHLPNFNNSRIASKLNKAYYDFVGRFAPNHHPGECNFHYFHFYLASGYYIGIVPLKPSFEDRTGHYKLEKSNLFHRVNATIHARSTFGGYSKNLDKTLQLFHIFKKKLGLMLCILGFCGSTPSHISPRSLANQKQSCDNILLLSCPLSYTCPPVPHLLSDSLE